MTKVASEPIDQNNNSQQSKKFEMKPKIFKVQDSYVSRSLTSIDMKSLYHIILAFVLYFCFANALYCYTHPEALHNEFMYVISSMKHIEIFCAQHLIFTVLLLFFIHPLTKLWISLRTKCNHKISLIDLIYSLTVVGIVGLLYSTTLAAVFLLDINPVMSVALISDKVRFTMKTVAFVLECKRKQEAALRKDKKDAKFSTRKQLLYYLVAPTLVYRDEYPRLEKRDYKLMVKLTLQYAICLYFMLIIQCRIFIPILSQIGLGPIEGKTFVKNLCYLFLGSSAYCLLCFYSFLHCYSNLTSQIFLFGDRVFYEDWWTCTDYSTYYRKWNILVHDWIYAYLYTPLVHLLRGNRVVAGLLSIYISALFHEYIIIVALRHINPILSLLFAGFGALFFTANGLLNIAHAKKVKKVIEEKNIDGELKEQLQRRKKEVDVKSFNFAINNTLFLLGTFNGWFLMITIYGIGYYSLKNCLNNQGIFPTYSMDCLNIKF